MERTAAEVLQDLNDLFKFSVMVGDLQPGPTFDRFIKNAKALDREIDAATAHLPKPAHWGESLTERFAKTDEA
jgi:hypothetical protein